MTSTAGTTQICYHCGDVCHINIIHDNKHFCCQGCHIVYQVLQQNNLCNYYSLNSFPGVKVEGSQIHAYDVLADESFATHFIQYKQNDLAIARFYLPDIHCSSCLYLLEKLPSVEKGILQSDIDFAAKYITITYHTTHITLQKIALLLHKLGYKPDLTVHKSKTTLPTRNVYLKELGVAAISFVSIMMLSLAEYFAGKQITPFGLGKVFTILSIVLATPAVLYSFKLFYQPAWYSLRQRFISIDVPIVFATVLTLARSIYEVTTGIGPGYWDSLTGIIFFMVLGRFLQKNIVSRLEYDRDIQSFFPISVRIKIDEKNVTHLPIEEVKVNDIIYLYEGEILPVDGVIWHGSSDIDYSFVTGEQQPVYKQMGEMIYAGGKTLNGSLQILVVNKVDQSYLTALWNKESRSQKEDALHSGSFVHQVSKYFAGLLLLIASVAAIYWYTVDATHMWKAMISVLIIACPCTLLLSATFSNTNLMRVLARYGFFVKNFSVIEKMANARHIIFDKTGTLTSNSDMKVTYVGQHLTENEIAAIQNTAVLSFHPYSKAITRCFAAHTMVQPDSFLHLPGKGIEAVVLGMRVQLGSAAWLAPPHTQEQQNVAQCTYVKINGQHYGRFVFESALRPDTIPTIKTLAQHYRLSVLSGDQPQQASLLRSFFPSQSTLLFQQKPQDKLSYIQSLQQHEKCIMIGDGLNDAGALEVSDVGIILAEQVNNFYPVCDAICNASYFKYLPTLFSICRKSKVMVLTTFVISILYNVFGIYYAVTAQLTPLIAAILMPLSSISIMLASSLIIYWQAARKLQSKL